MLFCYYNKEGVVLIKSFFLAGLIGLTTVSLVSGCTGGHSESAYSTGLTPALSVPAADVNPILYRNSFISEKAIEQLWQFGIPLNPDGKDASEHNDELELQLYFAEHETYAAAYDPLTYEKKCLEYNHLDLRFAALGFDVMNGDEANVLLGNKPLIKEPQSFTSETPPLSLLSKTPLQNPLKPVCITQNNDSVYILSNTPDTVSDTVTDTVLFSFDPETAETQELLTLSDKGHWCGELNATDHSLFWVFSDSTAVRIMRYDLQTAEQTILREFPPDTVIVLSSDDRYLSWLEMEGTIKKIHIFDTQSEEFQTFAAPQRTVSPYGRAELTDHILISREANRYDQILCAYDLDQKQYLARLDVEEPLDVVSPQANQNWIVWTNKRRDAVYAYHIPLQKFYKFEDSLFVFSLHLYNNHVFVNDRTSNNILCYNLDTQGKSAIPSEETVPLTLGNWGPAGLIFWEGQSGNLIHFIKTP